MNGLVSNRVSFLAGMADPKPVSGLLLLLVAGYLLLMLAGAGLDVLLLPRVLRRPDAWARRAARIRVRPWTLRSALCVALLLVGVQVIAVGLWKTLAAFGSVPDPGDADTGRVFAQGLVFHGAALLLLMGMLRARRWSWGRAFGLRTPGLARRAGMALTCYAGVLPAFMTAAMVSQLVMLLFGRPLTIQDFVLIFMKPQSAWTLMGLLSLALVLAPLAEEALFRGVLLPALMKRMGTGPAVVLSSLLFAAVHVHAPSFLPLFVLAVGLALAYIQSGSLWVPAIMHAVFNGLNLALLLAASP